MSRIGKKPIAIPAGVKVLVDSEQVLVEGSKGKLSLRMIPGISVGIEEGKVLVRRPDNQRQSRANQGLVRALVANMVLGVHQEFEKVLDISGVGYRAEKSGNRLVLHLGYSHRVEFEIPEMVDVVVDKPNRLIVRSIDRQKLGQVAATIRGTRKPDPYKAKGITYEGERILRKAGKKAVS